MLSSTRQLLDRLDPLPYRARTRALAVWARTATDRREVCADLRAAGSYERFLALTAATVAGDAAGVDAALDDPLPAISAAAWQAALHVGRLPATDLDLPSVQRRRIYRSLRARRVTAIADALMPQVRELYGDREAAVLLPACGTEVIRRLLPALDHLVNLTALARRHPDLVLDHVALRLEAAGPAGRDQVWAQVGPAVLHGEPARVLDLLELHPPRHGLPGSPTAYGVVAAHDPGRVARLLSDPRRADLVARAPLPDAVLRRLAVLGTDELVPLARRMREHPGAWAALLDAVAPARRGDLYHRALADVDTAARIPARQVMEVLPLAVRVREATRVLGLARIREQEPQIWAWSACLSWPQATAVLSAALRGGDADERAAAYRLLVDAARRSRDPEAVAEVVARLSRLRNEQDPVRSAALGALVKVARLLTPGTTAGLTTLLTDAVEARDASAATMAALRDLAVEVLRVHVGSPELSEWALLAIDLVSVGRTLPPLGRFDRDLRRGQEAAVFERLRDWISAGMARGRHEPLFAVTHALGRRARRLPELQGLLRRAIAADNVTSVIETAVGLWLDDPRTRGDRVIEVLAVDSSTVTLPVVWDILSTSRTDLLDEVLGRAPRGRFLKAGVRWVPGPARHPERWLPRQQAAYAALKERVIADAGASSWQRAAALADVAGLPEVGHVIVRRHLDSPDVVLAEAALGALIRTDRPGVALSILLGHADDDRARVAMYAAGRAAGHVEPSRLPALLGGVLFGAAKVTSRKSAARLLGRYGPPQSGTTLLEAYTRTDQHPDVRAAIVGAARGRLWDPVAWTVLAAAVHGGRAELRAVLAARPAEVAEAARGRYAELIVAACASTDREVARAAFLALPAWSRWAPDLTALITGRLTDLDEQTGIFLAAQLVGALHGRGLDAILDRLVELDEADADPGGPLRDRPARRRIELLARAVTTWIRLAVPETDRSPATAAAGRLTDRAPYVAAGMTMLVGLSRLDGDDLGLVADRCADRPVLAVRTAERIGTRLDELREPPEPSVLLSTADRLARRGDLAGGLFALTLADQGWAAPWRDLLRDLRHHPVTEVRDEAYLVDMA
ncbi:hypothetical protein ACWKSP_04815 [Micromonosporaceae bacterium Da 78-11]